MRSCPRCRAELEGHANFCVACGADLREDEDPYPYSAPDPLIGQTVADRYRILELVGRGGMGVVYKVEHVRMGKLMAMKLLHGELAADRDVIKRFKTEAQAVSRLSHPNTVQVFDFGRADGLMFLVMEYVAGIELARMVRREGRVAFPRAAALAVQVCSSLAEAHDLGIVHRDLKPENVLVTKNREGAELVKVLDFGLAKLREAEERSDTTHRGLLVGTPHYMSPEQIRGEHMDHRTDIYAFGAMMYKVLTGDPPFKAATPVGVLTKHLTEEPLPIGDAHPEAEVPAEGERIVMRCLAKRPADRYSSVDEIREELLEQLASGEAEDLLPSDSALSSRPVAGFRSRVRKAAELVAGTTPAGALRVGDRLIQISSRSDFDRYERDLRLKRALSLVGALAALVLVAAGVLVSVLHLREGPRAEEDEPNNQPADAELLFPGHPMRGTVGKRVSPSESDRDWYRVVNEGASRRAVSVEVSGIPRMDLILQVFDRNVRTPLAESDSGRAGEREAVDGLVVDGLVYYVLVREVWVQGRPPTENVSDPYEIRVELGEPSPPAREAPDAGAAPR